MYSPVQLSIFPLCQSRPTVHPVYTCTIRADDTYERTHTCPCIPFSLQLYQISSRRLIHVPADPLIHFLNWPENHSPASSPIHLGCRKLSLCSVQCEEIRSNMVYCARPQAAVFFRQLHRQTHRLQKNIVLDRFLKIIGVNLQGLTVDN